MTEMEIIQSTPTLSEPVLSAMDSQTDLFDICFGDSMAHGESQLTVSIDVTAQCVGPSFCEYEPFLPLYQCRYQSTPQFCTWQRHILNHCVEDEGQGKLFFH